MPETVVHTAQWLLSPPAPPLAQGALAVRDGIVIAVGPRDELLRGLASPQVIDHPGCAILPGFVNAHTHLELTHFPAWRLRTNVDYHPRRFVDWLIQLLKIKRGIAADEIPSSLAEGIRMCLESGTTVVGEIISNPSLAALYHASPLSGRLFFEVLGHDPLRFGTMLQGALQGCALCGDSRFAPGLSPHAPYTIAEQHLPRIRQESASRGLPLAIHLAESPAEADFIFDTSGPLAEEFYPFLDWQGYLMPPRRCSSTELLDRAGLLTPATLAVHCVHLTLADAETIKRRGVSVALCPRSNERLDVGRAPVALLRKLGVTLALGTDSLASNDSLSLWDEMRFALDAFLELSPADMLEMVTVGGAAALGMAAAHGSLEAGRQADFQVIGHIGEGTEELLERIIYQGMLEDVYLAGGSYTAAAAGSSLHRRAGD
jgi:cytosine/adenosine deaminase-related metal-dependent hydrolase